MLWRVGMDLKLSMKLIFKLYKKEPETITEGNAAGLNIICLFIRNTFEMRGRKEQDPLSLHFFVVVEEFVAKKSIQITT